MCSSSPYFREIAANGLMVYAQKTIQIGTISIAQVVNPAIAVFWSFLLIDETLRLGQAVGIAISVAGLAAFLWLNQRGARARRATELLEAHVATDGPVGPAVT